MGIITITYIQDGQEVDPNNLIWDTRTKLYHLQEKYEILNHLELEDDIQLTFNLDGQLEEIDWSSEQVPDPDLIEAIIVDSDRYRKFRKNLDNIVSEINGVSYKNKYRMKELAKRAVSLLKEFKLSEHFDNSLIDDQVQRLIADLQHTINEEVDMLVSTSEKSERKKNSRLNDARKYLVRDIELFLPHLWDLKLI